MEQILGNTVESREPITLVGGGIVAEAALIAALGHAPRLIAVDGGADAVLATGRAPEAVIGDLDSISDAARARLADRLIHSPGQDDTDFDKALTGYGGAPFLLCLGFTGGRLDHSLAALSGLARAKAARAVIVGEEDLCLLLPPELRITLPEGVRLSLFPLSELGCDSEGLVWPTTGLRFSPSGRIGTSNAAKGGLIRLAPEGPGMLLLLPAGHLEALLASLQAAPRW